jgi:hypothetical protein
VCFEVHGLVGQLPVRADGQQLWMQEPVERIDVARAHRRLQRALARQYGPLRCVVAHAGERIELPVPGRPAKRR